MEKMLNFNFSGSGTSFPTTFVYDFSRKCFSCYILLTDHISQSDYLYFSRYWAIWVSQLFVNQAVTSLNLKLTLSLLSSRFVVLLHDQKVKTKT